MSEKTNKADDPAFQLTPDVITTVELSRITREAESLDEFLYQVKLRSPGANVTVPKTTHVLEKVAEANGLSLLNATHRKHLIGNLRALAVNGKKIHISFAVEPAPAIVQKIVIWLRTNIHSNIIVEVGVQPTISVGCIVRTTNKVFDMSLRHRFGGSKKILSDLVEKSQ